MRYYHLLLFPISQKLCTNVLPKGNYKHNELPMGLCSSPDIFQEKMTELFNGLEYVRAYIDDLLIICNNNFEDNVNKIKIALNKLKATGFKINTEKSLFASDNLEYLGFKITR